MIKAIIVDDEENAILLLQMQMKRYCPQIEIMAVAQRVKEAIPLIKLHQPQIVFLDIEMAGGSGFDLLEKIQQQNFHVIFVTAHPGYAIKAFRFSVTDFLLKPVDREVLIQAVQKVETLIDSAGPDNKADGIGMRTLRIPFRNGVVFVYFKDIIRMEAEGHYTNIYLRNGKRHVSSHAIKQFEEIIDSDLFYRAHRSHLINLRHIKSINHSAGLILEMNDDAKIEIPRRNKEDFLKLLHLRNINI